MRTAGHRAILLMGTFLCGLVLMILSSGALWAELPQSHPVEVDHGRCTECHMDKRYGVEHTAGWYGEHRFQAAQNEALCAMCHAQSFCADCHARREEIKPSEKVTENPARSMPHRGDYITRHKIDARIDPAPCFRCHGRGNNAKCKICHR